MNQEDIIDGLQIFKDLPLPKEFSKRKKISLYKAFLLDPKLIQASDNKIPNLDIRVDIDRYFLRKEDSYIPVILEHYNSVFSQASDIEDIFNNFFRDKVLVIAEVIIPFDKNANIIKGNNEDIPYGRVDFNSDNLSLNVSIIDLPFDINITYHSIDTLVVDLGVIKELKIREIISQTFF